MQRTFQKWLFVFVLLTFVLTFRLLFTFQTMQADRYVESLIRLKQEYVRQQIILHHQNLDNLKKASELALLEKIRVLAYTIAVDPDAFLKNKEILKKWSKDAGLADVSICDENGKVVNAYPQTLIGSDFQKSRYFPQYLKLIDRTESDFIEAFQQEELPQVAGFSTVQYADVSRQDAPGFIRARLADNHYVNVLKNETLGHLAEDFVIKGDQGYILIRKDARHSFRIGDTGNIVIFKNGRVIASSLERLAGKTVQEMGLPIQAGVSEKGTFRIPSDRGILFCVYTRFENYLLVGTYPEKEMYVYRNKVLFLSFLFLLIIFCLIYFLITVLLKKIVINGIKNTNISLDRITNGDLNEKVDVRTSIEFISLSNGINTMVDALKGAIAREASRFDEELKLAHQIQEASLPALFPPYPDKSEFDIYAGMYPAKEVGGDFYDFFLLGEKLSRIMVVIADVSGKGIPAALFMMSAKTLIKSLAESGLPPADILTQANKVLCENNETDMFVTAFIGILDVETGNFIYANAGHNPPLLRKGDGDFAVFKQHSGFVLGAVDHVEYKQSSIIFDGGDTLFLYTDGITEAQNKQLDLYGNDRLLSVLNGKATDCVKEMIENVKKDISDFVSGVEQFDDITMLGLRYNVYRKVVPGVLEEYEQLADFVSSLLSKRNCSQKVLSEIMVVIDEIFSNIVRYAYQDQQGEVSLSCSIGGDPRFITLCFEDSGIPFNPLNKADPDISLSIQEREIGNLGIFMVKNIMNEVLYEYRDGKNILTLYKVLE